MMPMSRPCAVAKRLPCTMVPTMTEAGPTSETVPPTRQNYMKTLFITSTRTSLNTYENVKNRYLNALLVVLANW